MNVEFFETLGKFGGIGGISLGVLLLIVREIIKNINATNNENAFAILRLIIILIFITSILCLIGWFTIEIIKLKNKDNDEKMLELTFTNKPLTVIGIYPNDAFGNDQKEGLRKSLQESEHIIELVDLDFMSFEEMKSGDLTPLIDSLKSILNEKNVLAVVGPSITECTDDVLRLFKKKKSSVPIFITSAASQKFLKWKLYNKDLNLLRTGTGIDTRAELVHEFLRNDNTLQSSFILVESSLSGKTFGQMYLDELKKHSDIIEKAINQNQIKVFEYDNSLSKIDEFNELVKSEIFNYKYGFILGVGKHFNLIVDSFYRDKQNLDSLPKFGGWMNGYALNKELEKDSSDILNEMIFEITDLDILRANGVTTNSSDLHYLNEFKNHFSQTLHPGLRDFAITYDAGICIREGYSRLISDFSTENENRNEGEVDFFNHNEYYDLFVAKMKDKPINAVSSLIYFDEEGININSKLNGAIYNSIDNKWNSVDLSILFR